MFFHPCHSPYLLSSLIFKASSPLLTRKDFHRAGPSISATVYQIKLTIFQTGKFYGQNLLPSKADFRKHFTSRRKKTFFFRLRGAFENCLRFDVRILKFLFIFGLFALRHHPRIILRSRKQYTSANLANIQSKIIKGGLF